MLVTKDDIAAAIGLIRKLRIVKNGIHAEEILASLAVKKIEPVVVSWLNAHALILALTNIEFREHLQKSTLIFRDGIGVSILLRLMGLDAGINMNGTDLIPRILQKNVGRSVALLGTQEPYLTKAAEAVEKLRAKVVLTMDGFQPAENYIARVNEVNADVIVLAMGMPKQEGVAMALAENLHKPCVILNGGAILDFMAKRFPRAPEFIQSLRLEWLFRLVQEPRRLWRRYILGGFQFAYCGARIIVQHRMDKRVKD